MVVDPLRRVRPRHEAVTAVAVNVVISGSFHKVVSWNNIV
jgi:hypothetical protein